MLTAPRHYKGLVMAIVSVLVGAMLPLPALAQVGDGGTLTGIAGADGTLGGLLASVAAILIKIEIDRRKVAAKADPLDTRSSLAVLEERTAGLRRDLDAYRADSRAADAATREDLAQRIERIDTDIRRVLDL